MTRRLPPLRALVYFESVARRRNLVAAAEELGVTKGAVSQQLRLLEEYLGVALFDRSGRRLELTDAGQRYFIAARTALDELEDATARLSRQRRRRSFRISALPAFVSLWLIRRLHEFQARHPDVDIEVSSEAALVDFTRSDAHLGIRFGRGEAAGLSSTLIATDSLIPVCSPAYAQDMNLKAPADLARCRLLHDTSWRDDWQKWCSANGVTLPQRQEGQFYSLYSVAIDAARAGGGIAMGHALLVRDYVAANELVTPFPLSVPAREPYTLVKPDRARHLSFVTAFEQWLIEAFDGGAESLKAQPAPRSTTPTRRRPP